MIWSCPYKRCPLRFCIRYNRPTSTVQHGLASHIAEIVSKLVHTVVDEHCLCDIYANLKLTITAGTDPLIDCTLLGQKRRSKILADSESHNEPCHSHRRLCTLLCPIAARTRCQTCSSILDTKPEIYSKRLSSHSRRKIDTSRHRSLTLLEKSLLAFNQSTHSTSRPCFTSITACATSSSIVMTKLQAEMLK